MEISGEDFRNEATRSYHRDAHGFRVYHNNGFYMVIIMHEFFKDATERGIRDRLHSFGLPSTLRNSGKSPVLVTKDGLRVL